ncbi:Aste57867_24832 [Aphanomyces stellatus]|uniref:Aste57867_24832 protein n=1 Tax=Aphanomyces stellatus TaxID=120398 RepID=A0A485LVR8_9STRA|nr:hypothetical protein As57867_024754 [Aphanomyces stellatus]VFU01467.1 Aste57867_24832 [Aphanomyces stellatus]
MGLPRLMYSVNLDKVGDNLRSKFVPSDCDDETTEFLDSCFQTSLYNVGVSMLSTVLNLFYSVTDTNGMLGRGQMFVFSRAQAARLLNFPNGHCGGKLLDIGAGDGNVTAKLATFVDTVHATEVSQPMVRALNAKGFHAIHTTDLSHPDIVVNGPYDLISLLNVLDRADTPLTLLRQIHELLAPNGVVLIAVVLPFSSFVEVGTQKLPPSEILPMKGGLCADGDSFEDAARIMTERVFGPSGFDVHAFSRVPYLCRGDISQPYYVLYDALFTLKKISADF